MDGVSAAATILQLIDSVQKLVKFCRAVQKAPSAIKSLSEELQLLSSVLFYIQSNNVSIETDSLELQLLQLCQKKVQTLYEKLSKRITLLNSRNIRLRNWTLFTAVLELPELKDLRDDIERTKNSLVVFMVGTHR
jgi:hypothetical protein